MKIETYARTAALFLTIVLLLGLYARQEPTKPRGQWIYVAGCEEPNPGQPSENRLVVLQIASDSSLKINQDQIDRQSFPNPLPLIFSTRARKNLYVIAAPEISYQEFLSDVSSAQDAIPELNIIVIPPAILQRPCGLISPTRVPQP